MFLINAVRAGTKIVVFLDVSLYQPAKYLQMARNDVLNSLYEGTTRTIRDIYRIQRSDDVLD